MAETVVAIVPVMAIIPTVQNITRECPFCEIDVEENNLTDFSSVIDAHGDMTVTSGAALAGTKYGMNVLIDDTDPKYGEKTIGSQTGVCRFRFYLNPNNLAMSAGDYFGIFALYNSNNQLFGYVYIYSATGTGDYKIRAVAVEDNASPRLFTDFTITDAPHYIEMLFTRETSDAQADGSATLWIDNTIKQAISDLENFIRFSDLAYIRMGAFWNGVTTTGNLFLDECIINITGTAIGER